MRDSYISTGGHCLCMVLFYFSDYYFKTCIKIHYYSFVCSDKNKATCNSIYTSISGATSVSGNKLTKSAKKSNDTVNDILGRQAASPEKVVKRRSRPKIPKPDTAKNGKKAKSEKKKSKQPKEVFILHQF